MDFTHCSGCGQLIEAGGDNLCTCGDDDGYGDYLYEQEKDRRMMEDIEREDTNVQD